MTSPPRATTPRPVRAGGFALPRLLFFVLGVGVLVCSVLTPAAGAAKVRHDLTVSSEEVGGEDTNDFRLFGAVSTYKGRKLKIQIRVNGGAWKLWRTSVTEAEDGAFSSPIYGGKRGSKVCYKVVVPSTKRYKTTKRKAGCIRTY